MIEDRKTDAMSVDAGGLPALEARLAQELALLERPARPWVPRTHLNGAEVLDVAVIGAGLCAPFTTMSGLMSMINRAR